MSRRIIAFFASSFLTVAMTIPASAVEAEGIVLEVNEESEQMQLSDGKTYDLPKNFDYRAIAPGMPVHVIYDEASGQNVYPFFG
ncbi:hypothetical protein FP2506_13244 [Fulvimarina pelagi HTCC2506]|uniref:DUF1344 domain-containing protein n=1 Tax=Fulvimarina pelagi HTCC2506 TaxID=314231 RepID=Q0FXN4_9HYPH|nr:DUF1344 domain-containing protein [Fulvimarina pelagi]EAU39702.1 hypothetical protein FP2506_13244 [Fulvimarina pelagi HTCC2506]